MKYSKIIATVLAAALIFSAAGCKSKNVDEKSEGVMTYAEYVAAKMDSEVVVEAYVQAKQSYYAEKSTATIYTQDKEGAYFLYNASCTKDVYDKLVPGTKIKVTGYKAEWAGEVEITDAKIEILDGKYIAKPLDVTSKLSTPELINYQNQFVSFNEMTVEPSADGKAFLYNWDGSGSQGNDLYFNVSKDGKKYTFVVESYLCDKDSEVYKTVENLKVGDKVNMEGFLYWYEGVNPHITSVIVK